ncbi:hypothetical protein NLJ89_g11978 [Agrocybe chaxingu]|uniref:Uncharacterized protein n=1 Tax=Agrocybe chaxingu TaxID=84603 RepID=A0A9W8JVR1_9AGAR|nr:hypothetical protein NLJ89_g11978 [Agrocybe chaxingu]
MGADMGVKGKNVDVQLGDRLGQRQELDQPVTPVHASPSVSAVNPSITPSVNADVKMGDGTSPQPSPDDNLPPWLKTILAHVCVASEREEWRALVDEWIGFEKLNPVSGNLPTKNRPPEVAAWIKSKKKDITPTVNPDKFGRSFASWWMAIQPHWRVTPENNLVQEVRKTEKWEMLVKGGTAGIYVVVMALSWWLRALKTDKKDDPTWATAENAVWATVDDVSWVLSQLRGTVSRRGTKRPLREDAEKPAKKRSRT